MRFNKGIHNILVERAITSENMATGFYGAIWQTNMATDSFNIYLSPVGVKSLVNWQAGAKLIRHVRQYNGFMTCLKGTRPRGYVRYWFRQSQSLMILPVGMGRCRWWCLWAEASMGRARALLTMESVRGHWKATANGVVNGSAIGELQMPNRQMAKVKARRTLNSENLGNE